MIIKVLTKCLENLLDNITYEIQSGFMKAGHNSNNIRHVLDTLDYSDLISDDSFILLLDLKIKLVEHNFPFLILKRFGFPCSFKKKSYFSVLAGKPVLVHFR